MKTVERPTRTGALVRWNLSLAASLAVHGGLFVWLWVSIFSLAPRGGERPPGPELSAEKRPEAIPEPEEVPEAAERLHCEEPPASLGEGPLERKRAGPWDRVN